MAQFRAVIAGQRGEASRLGNKKSGIVARVNGWDSGVRVDGVHDEETGDRFEVYATGGSNARISSRLLGTVDGSGNWEPAK